MILSLQVSSGRCRSQLEAFGLLGSSDDVPPVIIININVAQNSFQHIDFD